MKYNGPGNTNELKNELLDKWHNELSSFFDGGKQTAMNEMKPPHHKSWFFNPIQEGTSGSVVADIKWNAFPKRLLDQSASKRSAWRKADSSRDNQEEYCEWEVVRDSNNAVVRVTFSTETPDYYQFLYKNSPDLLLELYHKHVSPNVKLKDLEVNGEYNQQNHWNYPEKIGKKGIMMHMGFGPNTLGAAINLSAEATWPSVDGQGDLITDEQGLIRCRRYGAAQRHSDPHIGAQINGLVRMGNEVSFAGPTGLYIDDIDLSRFEVPNGVDVRNLVKVIRGDGGHMMRIIFEAPKSEDFSLANVKIDGEPIMFGGQIAETLTIRIRGLAKDINEVPPKINCSGQSQDMTDLAFETFSILGSRKHMVSYVQSEE